MPSKPRHEYNQTLSAQTAASSAPGPSCGRPARRSAPPACFWKPPFTSCSMRNSAVQVETFSHYRHTTTNAGATSSFSRVSGFSDHPGECRAYALALAIQYRRKRSQSVETHHVTMRAGLRHPWAASASWPVIRAPAAAVRLSRGKDRRPCSSFTARRAGQLLLARHIQHREDSAAAASYGRRRHGSTGRPGNKLHSRMPPEPSIDVVLQALRCTSARIISFKLRNASIAAKIQIPAN